MLLVVEHDVNSKIKSQYNRMKKATKFYVTFFDIHFIIFGTNNAIMPTVNNRIYNIFIF